MTPAMHQPPPGPALLTAEPGRAQRLAGLSPSEEEVALSTAVGLTSAEPASPASRDGAAVGYVAVTEMRSLGSEIRFNCIRNSCQIKLAEVLQN